MYTFRQFTGLLVLLILACGCRKPIAPTGKAEFQAFTEWKKQSPQNGYDWDQSISAFRAKLSRDGRSEEDVERALRAIVSYDEAELYDKVYSAPADFNTQPNKLLQDAVQNRTPGTALDVAMGQGRNALYLASLGWKVTGFDVSQAGLRRAELDARARGLSLTAVHSSDEDFDWGNARWDLISLIYAIEKRSVTRAREALKPGGIIIVEAGHRSASGAHFEYETDELRKIFDGFKIIRYEEPVDIADWSRKPIRLVRLIAEKPKT